MSPLLQVGSARQEIIKPVGDWQKSCDTAENLSGKEEIFLLGLVWISE